MAGRPTALSQHPAVKTVSWAQSRRGPHWAACRTRPSLEPQQVTCGQDGLAGRPLRPEDPSLGGSGGGSESGVAGGVGRFPRDRCPQQQAPPSSLGQVRWEGTQPQGPGASPAGQQGDPEPQARALSGGSGTSPCSGPHASLRLRLCSAGTETPSVPTGPARGSPRCEVLVGVPRDRPALCHPEHSASESRALVPKPRVPLGLVAKVKWMCKPWMTSALGQWWNRKSPDWGAPPRVPPTWSPCRPSAPTEGTGSRGHSPALPGLQGNVTAISGGGPRQA